MVRFEVEQGERLVVVIDGYLPEVAVLRETVPGTLHTKDNPDGVVPPGRSRTFVRNYLRLPEITDLQRIRLFSQTMWGIEEGLNNRADRIGADPSQVFGYDCRVNSKIGRVPGRFWWNCLRKDEPHLVDLLEQEFAAGHSSARDGYLINLLTYPDGTPESRKAHENDLLRRMQDLGFRVKPTEDYRDLDTFKRAWTALIKGHHYDRQFCDSEFTTSSRDYPYRSRRMLDP